MHDFPPVVPDFEDAATAPLSHPRAAVDARTDAPAPVTAPVRSRSRGDFSRPETRSPARFLFWLIRQQRSTVLLLTFITVLQWVPGALGPYVVGLIIDAGITARDLGVVGRLCLVLLGLVLVGGTASVLSHTLIVRTWLVGMYGTTKLVTRKVTQLGHVLPQRTPTSSGR
jgi:ABC-type bacteriocin/lantibiotic exporter with double-glycine peptidase domain